MSVLAVPRSMAMSLEMAPKSEEIMEGPGDWGLERGLPGRLTKTIPSTPKRRVESLRFTGRPRPPSALPFRRIQGIMKRVGARDEREEDLSAATRRGVGSAHVGKWRSQRIPHPTPRPNGARRA